MTDEQAKGFLSDIASVRVLENEPMARHTTLKVGGPARFFVIPSDENEVAAVLRAARAHALPLMPLGRGSNLLVCDEGYDGVMVYMGENLGAVTVSENRITAGAGAPLSVLAGAAAGAGLAGLQFAGGIPGSVGGGVMMNAGAFGAMIADCVESVRCAGMEGNVMTFSKEDMHFSYRHSRVMEEKLIVLSAVFRLEEGDREGIYDQMKAYAASRREKQPLNYPSAGSFFKRPEGNFAGALIEQAGLKGLTVGGAQVSEKHAGFLINVGGATANDFLTLKEQVQQRVMEAFGIRLEPEVRIVSKP